MPTSHLGGERRANLLIPALVEVHAQGRFPFDRTVKTYPFERIEEAIEAAERGKVLRSVLLMPDPNHSAKET